MLTRLSLPEPVFSPAPDDLAAIVQIQRKHLLNIQNDGVFVNESQVNNSERALKLRALVKLTCNEIRVHVALQLDNDPESVAV